MARQVKRFGEHSQRWQNEAKRQGMTARKWNKWRKLSDPTRKATNPYEYSKGKTVTVFRTEKKQQAVFESLSNVHKDNPKFCPRTVRERIKQMTEAQMNHILSFKTTDKLREFIRKQLRGVPKGEDSVYYYQ